MAKAFARTEKPCTPETIELITSEIIDEYGDLPTDVIIQALMKGGRGKYGGTFILSVQQICIWIDRYIKENPEADIDNDKYTYYRFTGKQFDYYLFIRRILKGEIIEREHTIIETDILGNRKKQW